MNIWAVYFSATGTTKKIILTIAQTISQREKSEVRKFDFTLPHAREGWPAFQAGDIVVFGVPVYAGRVPNVLVKYLKTVRGNGAYAVPVVTYGNRNFDDALLELRDLLAEGGFVPVAAAAFIGEHAFSECLAKGRPDEKDLEIAEQFGKKVCEKLLSENRREPSIPGIPLPYRGYYQPRGEQGEPIDIRKVKPQTGELCDQCGICAEVCPMGSISKENAEECVGICIKCGACVKKCPMHAKYFDDPGYLHHLRQLEDLTERREPELFL